MGDAVNAIVIEDDSDIDSSGSDEEVEIVGTRRATFGDDTCFIDKVRPSPFLPRRIITEAEYNKRKRKEADEKKVLLKKNHPKTTKDSSNDVVPTKKRKAPDHDPSQTTITHFFSPAKRAREPLVSKKTKALQNGKDGNIKETHKSSGLIVARKTIEGRARAAARRAMWRNLDSGEALSSFLTYAWAACVAFFIRFDGSDLKDDMEQAASCHANDVCFASMRLNNNTRQVFLQRNIDIDSAGLVLVLFVNGVEKDRFQDAEACFDKAALHTMIKKLANLSRVSVATNVTDNDSEPEETTEDTVFDVDTDDSFLEERLLEPPRSSSFVEIPMTKSDHFPSDPELLDVQTVQPKETDESDFVREPNPDPAKAPPLVTLPGFIRAWERVSKDCGFETTGELENSGDFRRANNSLSPEECSEQVKAQYGRIMFKPTLNMLENFLKLEKDDTFVDIGHGLGNTIFQAAFLFGCESRGIEICKERNKFARLHMESLSRLLGVVGTVRLKRGHLQYPENRRFLTRSGKRVVKAFCNNFNGVFGEKASKNVDWTLDQYLVGLFTGMKEGSKLLTLHSLPFFVDPLTEANEKREKNGLCAVANASFYEEEKVEFGRQNETVSWSKDSGNEKMLIGYLYTRVGEPKFVCQNASCPEAQAGLYQDAVVKQRNRWIPNVCWYCKSKMSMKTRNSSRAK